MIFLVCFLFSKRRFSLLCLFPPFLLPFTGMLLLGFCVFFPLLSAILLFLSLCCTFTGLTCQLFWCLLNNSLSKIDQMMHSLVLRGSIKTETKVRESDYLTAISWVVVRWLRRMADVCFAKVIVLKWFNTAGIPEICNNWICLQGQQLQYR